MRKANKVDIWMNGKKIKQIQNDKTPADQHVLQDSSEEHAAAVDNSNIMKTAEKDQQTVRTSSSSGHKAKARPFVLAAFSAIVIGSLLGFFLLNMFVDMNADMDVHESSRSSAIGSDEKAGNTARTDSDAQGATGSPLLPDSVFVLQAGKYSEQSNAQSKAEAYHAADYPGIIREKDGFFFVLAGIAGSSQKIEKMANEMAKEDMTVYAKKWKTAAIEKDLSSSDEEWLQAFTKQWETSLKQVNTGDSLSENKWSEVVDAAPGDSDQLVTDLAAFLADKQSQMGEGDKWHDQQILLRLWQKSHELLHG